MNKHFLFFLIIITLLTACQNSDAVPPTATPAPPTSTPLPPPTSTLEPSPTIEAVEQSSSGGVEQDTADNFWWNDVVFYEVFVRSFYDSDGDGKGDINGLIEKLDYINDGDPTTSSDLGATGIWLMPIAVSPSYHGYDVTNYFKVDPEYGTNEDFLRLMEEAHARGIYVIVDLVMNHTSSKHPWFIKSKNRDANERDWYLWQDESPRYRGPWGQGVWHKEINGYYYGVFWEEMPDLNYENPEVTAAMYEAAQFWLEEMNVDGFRLDAIKHIIEEGKMQENTPSTHKWLQAFYTFYKDVKPNALTVGEAWTSTQEVVKYTGNEVDIAFQFDLAQGILSGVDAGSASIFTKNQQEVYDSFPANQYATFITNHDQDRVMSRLRKDEAKARLAASLLLTGTGVPFIYYGEEIGMTGKKPDEDIRRPMQWTSEDKKVGFTTGKPWRNPPDDYIERSVALQDDDPDALLNHYRTLIHLRNKHDALRIGDWTAIETNSKGLYAFLRHTENEVLLIIINFSRNVVTSAEYSLDLAAGALRASLTAQSLFGAEVLAAPKLNANGGFANYTPVEELEARSTTIIKLLEYKNKD